MLLVKINNWRPLWRVFGVVSHVVNLSVIHRTKYEYVIFLASRDGKRATVCLLNRYV